MNGIAACIKIDRVPVEFNVAVIFIPINALLPIPVMTRRELVENQVNHFHKIFIELILKCSDCIALVGETVFSSV